MASNQTENRPAARRIGGFRSKLLLASAGAIAMAAITPAGANLTPAEIEAARNEGWRLAGEGRCAEAIPIFMRLGNSLSRALDYVEAANCAMQIEDSEAAVSALWEAIRRRDQLTPDQQVYALRSLGYQAEAQADWDRSLIGWDYAAQISNAASDRLMAARAARLSGRTGMATSRLLQIDPSGLQGDSLAAYYDERAQGMRETQPAAAAAYMQRAIAIDDQAWRRFDYALMLDAAGDTQGAIAGYRSALAADPSNADIQLSLAYALRRDEQNAEAGDLFAAIAPSRPDDASLREDMAYAYAAAGDNEAATAAFREVVDVLQRARPASTAEQEEVAAHLQRVRNEIRERERTLYGYAYATYRDEGAFGSPSNPQGAQSSIGGEINWRPGNLYSNGSGVTLYGRGYVGMEPGSFTLDEDSGQLAFGARWKPFRSTDFTIAAERLVALGDNARDDWAARASWGWSNGYDLDPNRDHWNYTSVYTDAAYLIDSEELYVYAQARQGRRFAVGENWAVTPYATVIAQYQDTPFGSDTRLEAGPGVELSRWMAWDEYAGYQQRVDFGLEYLFDIEGGDSDALMARVTWSY